MVLFADGLFLKIVSTRIFFTTLSGFSLPLKGEVDLSNRSVDAGNNELLGICLG